MFLSIALLLTAGYEFPTHYATSGKGAKGKPAVSFESIRAPSVADRPLPKRLQATTSMTLTRAIPRPAPKASEQPTFLYGVSDDEAEAMIEQARRDIIANGGTPTPANIDAVKALINRYEADAARAVSPLPVVHVVHRDGRGRTVIGSGLLLGASRVLTAAHVVDREDDPESFRVRCGGVNVRFTVQASDAALDYAVLALAEPCREREVIWARVLPARGAALTLASVDEDGAPKPTSLTVKDPLSIIASDSGETVVLMTEQTFAPGTSGTPVALTDGRVLGFATANACLQDAKGAKRCGGIVSTCPHLWRDELGKPLALKRSAAPALACNETSLVVSAPRATKGIGLKLSKRVFKRGERIDVTYTTPIDTTGYWITLAAKATDDSSYGEWHYVQRGARDDALVGQSSGTFEIRLHADYPARAFNVVARETITVE